MLFVDAIDLGLHLWRPALDQDGEFADQPARATTCETAIELLLSAFAVQAANYPAQLFKPFQCRF